MQETDVVYIKYSYINTFLQKLIAQYRQEEATQTVVENAGNKKIPVWILWLQGEAQMPEVVRLCYHSIRENFPQEKTEIHLLTQENLFTYICLPDVIIEKFNKGIISVTHLSDIIRFLLLKTYGGMWLDITYYIGKRIPEEFFTDQKLWIHRMEHPLWTADIVQGRWSCNLLMGPAGHKLFRFICDALLFYWQCHDSLIDYFVLDYIIAAAYENLEDVRSQMDRCPYSNPQIFALRDKINEAYDAGVYDDMISDTTFFKLSYKIGYIRTTEDGDPTLYDHLIGELES